jgi:CRISPR-associated protein Cas4
VAVILLIGLIILSIGYLMRSRGRAGEKRLGVRVRHIKSSDVGVDVPLKDASMPAVLFSKRHRVVGKPDYVVEDPECQGACIPVEKKSASVREPRDSDVFQVLTYCLLLEGAGYAVNRGRLKYGNGICEIPYGPRERQEVLQVLVEMREAEKLPLNQLPQKNDRRCTGCAYRTICRRGLDFFDILSA